MRNKKIRDPSLCLPPGSSQPMSFGWHRPSIGPKPPGLPSRRFFQTGQKSRAQESWQSGWKMWQALFSALSEPATMDAFSRGIKTLPDIVLRMAKTGWDGFFHLQQQWMERVGKMGQRSEAYQFENLDQGLFKSLERNLREGFPTIFEYSSIGSDPFSIKRG